MANIRSFPNNQDEYVGAEYVMRWLHGRSSGVFGAEGNAAVAPVLDTMSVTVSDGNGWISNDNADGVVWWIDNEVANGSKLQLTVDMADAVLPRIDRVVVSWQTTNYVALPEVTVLKGVPASNPVAPALTNNNILRQISLAAIRIPAGSTAITSDMITDERLDDSVCGLVTCGISVDTSVMQAQWTASYEEFTNYLENQKAAWEEFFQNIQNDTVFPVPDIDSIGKALVVNDTGDGYSLGAVRMYYANIPTDGWTESGERFSITIPVDGMPECNPDVDVVLDGLTAEQEDEILDAWGGVVKITVNDGSIVCYFNAQPEVSIPIKIKVVR
jgi:hypothetical protein